jgi:hypothetical protein
MQWMIHEIAKSTYPEATDAPAPLFARLQGLGVGGI